MSTTIKSYNILFPYLKFNNFSYLANQGKDYISRSEQIIHNMVEDDPDIICLQEISKDFFNSISLDKYTGAHAQHLSAHGKQNPDGVAIFFNKERYELKQIETSNNTQAGSKGRTTTGRRDLYVDLFDRQNKKTIRVATVHLVGGKPAQLGDSQMEEILNDLETKRPKQKYDIDNIIFTGDLNNEDKFVLPGTATRLDILKGRGYVINPSRGDECDATGNVSPKTISHIAVKTLKGQSPTLSTDDPKKYNGRTASDHAPVTVRMSHQVTPISTCPSLFSIQGIALAILAFLAAALAVYFGFYV